MCLHRWALWALLGISVQAQIKILNPTSLKDQYAKTNGFVMGATSVFGAPYYGERVLGKLRGSSNQHNHHCTDADYNLTIMVRGPRGEFRGGEKVHDIILIPHNGKGCAAIQKVIVAQRKGAKAVVLIDQTGQTDEQVQHKTVADYGMGGDVRIPSILVSKETGDRMYSAMDKDMVVVELSWDIPLAQTVSVDFWMSSASKESANFIASFKDSAELLNTQMQFKPHYYIFELPAGKGAGDLCADVGTCLGGIDDADCKKVRHCAPDPDGPGPITGADVANEDVRQLCLWHVTAIAPESPQPAVPPVAVAEGVPYSQKWWEYVSRLFDACPLQEEQRVLRFGSKTCSYKLMTDIAVSTDEIDSCVRHKSSQLLDEQAKKQAWSEQALRINGWRYVGPLDAETVLKAVCAGFATPIAACQELTRGVFSRFVTIFQHRVAHGLSEKAFTWMIIAICILSVINCYLYRRWLKRMLKRQMREEVMLEVQSQMAEYSKLDGGNGRR